MGKRYVALAEEYSFGTLGTSTNVQFAQVSESLVPDQGYLIEDTVENQRYIGAVKGPFIVAGSIDMVLKPELELGWLLKWLLGDYNPSTDSSQIDTEGVFEHTFQFGQTIKSFQTLLGIEDALRILTKCIANELTINIPKKEGITASLGMFAGGETKYTIGIPTFTTLRSFAGGACQVKIDGEGTVWGTETDVSAEIETASIRINNGYPYEESYGLNSNEPIRLEDPGRREVGVTVDAYFANTNWYDNFLAGDPFKMTFDLVGESTGSVVSGAEKYKLTILFNKCRLMSGSVPNMDRRERKVFSAPITVFQHDDDSFKLVNKQSSYPHATV